MFIAALPQGGLAGWRFVERMGAAETQRLTEMPTTAQTMAHAREKLASLSDVDDLMSDRRLLDVVLTAHGLGQNIDDQALVRKAIAEGDGPESFAERLGDSRWTRMAGRLDLFAESGSPPLMSPEVIDGILKDYAARSYADAVGEEDQILGDALTARGSLHHAIEATESESGTWYEIIASDPLRALFGTVLNLPDEAWTLDADTLVRDLESRFASTFGGSVRDLADPDALEAVMTRHVAIADAQSDTAGSSAADTALTILQARSTYGTGLL